MADGGGPAWALDVVLRQCPGMGTMEHRSPQPDAAGQGCGGQTDTPQLRELDHGHLLVPTCGRWRKGTLSWEKRHPTVHSRARGISEMPGGACHPAHGAPGMAQPGTSSVAPSWHPVPPQISQPLPLAAHGLCRSILTAPWVSPGANLRATHVLRPRSRENGGCPCSQHLRLGPSAPTQDAQAGAADEKPFGEEGACNR